MAGRGCLAWKDLRLWVSLATRFDNTFATSTTRMSFRLKTGAPAHDVSTRRRSDLVNERLPDFDPTAVEHEPHAPSMRPGLSRSWTELSTEQLIKQTLQEDAMDVEPAAPPGPRRRSFNR
jgi:hypothetical protein